MCNLLNDYFGTVFKDEKTMDKLPEVDRKESIGHTISELNITRENIKKKISNLKADKAPGFDRIVPQILKENADQLCDPIEYILKESTESGIIPSDWKRANITPIFKKGSRELPSNYRPISLTSHVCKTCEATIKDTLLGYLMTNNLIRDTQHGFVRKRSSLTNLLKFLAAVTNYIDKGLPVDVIYLDVQNAFDKVPHTRLMTKIEALAIRHYCLNLYVDRILAAGQTTERGTIRKMF